MTVPTREIADGVTVTNEEKVTLPTEADLVIAVGSSEAEPE